MFQQEEVRRRPRRLSLSVRVSLLLIVTAILPLLLTISISEWQSRPTLTNQARLVMETDAKTHAQLINTYFTQRLLDVQAFMQISVVQRFLSNPTMYRAEAPTILEGAQVLGDRDKDTHYINIALFDPQGNPLIYTPTKPPLHGQYLLPPEDVTQLSTTGKPFTSAVYYNTTTRQASVDIYAVSYSFALKKVLGFIRGTMLLNYVWGIVNSETGTNGSGSYAFILDQNGVRIADPNASRRFTAIAPLDDQTQQTISDEARYGTSGPVSVLADDTLNNIQHQASPATTFEMQPNGQKESFQVTRQVLTAIPWTYFVLSPVNTIVAVANQQLMTTALIALLVLIPAALFGLVVARRFTGPILASVGDLRSNSYALNTLATKQKNAANEQMWVVDSSQVGLHSVQYYNDAARVASRKLNDLSDGLMQRLPELDEWGAKQIVAQIKDAAQYIERAVDYQNTSNQKMSTAIKVTTQVTEQLVSGATSAEEASGRLDRVVNQLRQVVGR